MIMFTTLLFEASPNLRSTFIWKPNTFPLNHRIQPHHTNLNFTSITLSKRHFISSFHQNENLTPKSKSHFDILSDIITNTFKALQKPVITTVLLALLLTQHLNNSSIALAASGGRISGRSFSSSSPSSSSGSYSVSRTPLSSSSEDFSFSAPYYSSAPFGGGIYVAPVVGIGAGSSLFFILAGFAAFVLVSGFLSDRSEGSSVLTASDKTTVIKLQVGLLGRGRSIQEDLNRIAEVADTSSPEGLYYVLTETALALLRHPDYCISAYSSVDLKRDIEGGEKRFNQLSIEERGKFDEETLVNVNNIKRQSTRSQRSNGFSNEYIVV
ncbi:hypothetical protein Lalb_Chr15g0076891 [Lupinus albus]|uniref:Uncharacterized protein n=1 Tax=Lupinus albus TaxID=3870 RepID=A0A6A4P5T7_LUPAL|nr:hypothetical protein Lalb_Chr15g0076891 [Lupinus albus]